MRDSILLNCFIVKLLRRKNNKFSTCKGFTLIELIVVMAIIGILSTMVLVAVNPIEQFAKTRDTVKLSSMNQIIKAFQQYGMNHDNSYPDESNTWMNSLITENVLSSLPPDLDTSCSANEQNGYCYYKSTFNPSHIVVYTKLESISERSKNPTCSEIDNAYFVWSTCASSVGTNPGVLCSATDPTTFCDLPLY